MNRSLRRAAVTTLDAMLNNRVFYRTLGAFNRRTGLIASIFIAYPASAEYASYFFSDRVLEKGRWSPILCGVIRQNSRLVVGFGITTTESDFRKKENEDHLVQLAARASHLAREIGASHATFSGVLPGLMHRRGIRTQVVEADVTAAVVRQSLHEVEVMESLPPGGPVIVLGSKGFVGSALCSVLHDREVFGVDIGDPWPSHLEGQRLVVVNVSNSTVLGSRINRFWPGVVLLNEVYPEPSPSDLRRLSDTGIPAYHVVGVEALCLPSMPKAYAGGIPCCAAWLADDLTPMVRRLKT